MSLAQRPPVPIAALFTGPVRPLARRGHAPVPIGIAKSATAGPLRLCVTGFEGDEQGVHHYPSEHYAMWRTRFPLSPVSAERKGRQVHATRVIAISA